MSEVNISALEDEIEQLKKDAARYKWLAKNLSYDGYGWWIPLVCGGTEFNAPEKKSVDAVMDLLINSVKE